VAEEAKEKKAAVPRAQLKLWRQNLKDELDGAALYEAMAANEKDPDRASIFTELAEEERRHAAIWVQKLQDAGAEPVSGAVGAKARFLMFVARCLGTNTVFPMVQAIEKGANASYSGQTTPEAIQLAQVEKGHAKIFAAFSSGQTVGILGAEPWHRRDTGGSLRAAVFGVNDGLVSNFSLIMGVAGASQETRNILIAGVAGLLAGAFSMGAGEYVSVRSQRELFEHEIAKEKEELEAAPEQEKKELELIYRAKGLPKEAAVQLSESIMAAPGSALDTLAREELGLDPGDLGSPWKVAVSSFLSFAAGALIPLFPFLFFKGGHGVLLSAIFAGLALFAVGGALAFFTGKSALYSGLRMLCIGGLVALVTNGLGRLLGITLG
jgi:VIT1/CCC1 family predicted Fe2+/Mn2+ transporter